MSSINFLSENLVDDATLSLNTGTANSQYPLTNVQNESPSIKFRSTTSSVKIMFDMITTNSANTVAIAGDPLNTIGFTSANLRYSATTDFSGSPVIAITPSIEHNMAIEFFTLASARYWELELVGSTVVELGSIFIGTRFNLEYQNYAIDSFSYKFNDKSTFRDNEYGQAFIDVRNLQKRLSGDINYATKAEMTDIDDMFKYHGRHKPLWVIVDSGNAALDDGKYRFSSYGYLEDLPAWRANGGQHYSCSITIMEAI